MCHKIYVSFVFSFLSQTIHKLNSKKIILVNGEYYAEGRRREVRVKGALANNEAKLGP